MASRDVGGRTSIEPCRTFILVPGAWHGAWCWERVAPLLRDGGSAVVTPDLPGMGQDAGRVAVSLKDWADLIVDLTAAQSGKVVLVGHSRGGAVVSQAAEYLAEQVAALVYVSGMLLADGESIMSFGSAVGTSEALASAMVTSSDGASLSVRTELLGSVFYNTTEKPWVDRASRLVCDEPVAPNLVPLQLTDARFGQVPRYYVECLRDLVLPASLQRFMYERIPCRRLITLDTDHSPFYSASHELARGLLSIAAES